MVILPFSKDKSGISLPEMVQRVPHCVSGGDRRALPVPREGMKAWVLSEGTRHSPHAPLPPMGRNDFLLVFLPLG